MPTTGIRRSLLATTGVVGALALTLGAAAAAQAHVHVDGTSDAAGSSSVLTFSFTHGCDGSPTTQVAVQIPEGINAVAPLVDGAWSAEKVTEQLAEPLEDAHGNAITERVSQVVFTANQPIEDGFRGEVSMSLTLPDSAAGTDLAFPVVQSCESGENAWIQLADEGTNHDDLDSPAPTLAITAASDGDGHGHGASESEESSSSDHETTEATTAPASDPLAIVGLVVAGLALVAALAAIVIKGRARS